MAAPQQNERVEPPARSRAIVAKAKKGAVRAGIGVFAVMLLLALVVRGLQFSALRWAAVSMLLRFDLLIAFCAGLLGALVGGAAGAIFALQGRSPKLSIDPPKHPLD
jgi:hypothetical protein